MSQNKTENCPRRLTAVEGYTWLCPAQPSVMLMRLSHPPSLHIRQCQWKHCYCRSTLSKDLSPPDGSLVATKHLSGVHSRKHTDLSKTGFTTPNLVFRVSPLPTPRDPGNKVARRPTRKMKLPPKFHVLVQGRPKNVLSVVAK